MSSFVMTDSGKEIELTLKPVMDLSVAEDLRHDFINCLTKAKNIKVLGKEVVRITTPCLQILLSLKNEMTDQHIDLLVTEMSEPFLAALKTVGLDQQFFNMEPKV